MVINDSSGKTWLVFRKMERGTKENFTDNVEERVDNFLQCNRVRRTGSNGDGK